MATISARIDDQLKDHAEKIAESIGLPLSSVINIFLRRFIAEKGFPFEVKALDLPAPAPVLDPAALTAAVKKAVADPNNPTPPNHFTYFDADKQQPTTIHNGKEL